MDSENNKIVLFKDKADCCGCGSCLDFCPQNAIYMILDKEGFSYPEIDKEKCVRCCGCLRVCPLK